MTEPLQASLFGDGQLEAIVSLEVAEYPSAILMGERLYFRYQDAEYRRVSYCQVSANE